MYLLSGAEIWCPLSVLEKVHIVEVYFKENMSSNLFLHFLRTVKCFCRTLQGPSHASHRSHWSV